MIECVARGARALWRACTVAHAMCARVPRVGVHCGACTVCARPSRRLLSIYTHIESMESIKMEFLSVLPN